MSAPEAFALPCGDRSETGYICTLPAGHASAHADWTGSIAGRDVAPRAMWPYWPGVSEPDDAPSVPPVVWVEVNDDGAAVGATSSVAERDDLVRDGWRIVEYVPRAALDAMRAERDAALAEVRRLRATLARVRAVCDRPPRYADRHLQTAAEDVIEEVRAALGEPR